MSDRKPPGRAVYPDGTNLTGIPTTMWPGMTPLASRIADHILAETQVHGGTAPVRYEVGPGTWARLTDEMKPLMNPGHVVICGVMVVKHG